MGLHYTSQAGESSVMNGIQKLEWAIYQGHIILRRFFAYLAYSAALRELIARKTAESLSTESFSSVSRGACVYPNSSSE